MSTKIITIDGPAGAGKSTVAKALARKLGFAYLDTGAMYRALTLKVLRAGIPLEDEAELAAVAGETKIDLQGTADGVKVTLDGEDVSEKIRSVDVTNNTFYIARAARVREIMVQWQREIGRRRNVVVEGRDIGTVVFPEAAHKFYLDARDDERVQRRFKELQEKGSPVVLEDLRKDVKERDQKDFTRKIGPLKKAEDAVFIDSTDLPIEQVVQKIMDHIEK